MKTSLSTPTTKRKGIILLVVLAMLTLLAIIGITFVMYGTNMEAISDAAVEAESADTLKRFDPTSGSGNMVISPKTAMELFLGQLVYDSGDTKGKWSSIRGHSLARDMYGYLENSNTTLTLDKPFGGLGYGNPLTPNFIGTGSPLGSQPNVPWTTADEYHWYLAQVGYDTNGNMKIDRPSFWRQSSETATTTQQTFRPIAPYVGPLFNPAPYKDTSVTPNKWIFDVANLPTTNPKYGDSIWVDLGAPVMTTSDGKKRYKPLFAPLVIDLDGRLNLNWAGNKMASGNHASHEGYGIWEANINRLQQRLDPNLPGLANQIVSIRYGGDSALPFGTGFPAGGGTGGGGGGSNVSPRMHYPADFNAGSDPNGTQVGLSRYLPGSAGLGSPTSAFPEFKYNPLGSTSYGNFAHLETTTTGTGAGQFNHPVGYNSNFPGGNNLRLPPSEMAKLLVWSKKLSNYQSNPSTFSTANSFDFNTAPLQRALLPLLYKDLNNPYSGTNQFIWPANPAHQSLVASSNEIYGNLAQRNVILDHVTLLSHDVDKVGMQPFFAPKNSADPMDSSYSNKQYLEWSTNTPNNSTFVGQPWPKRSTNPGYPSSSSWEHNDFHPVLTGHLAKELVDFAKLNLGDFGIDYPIRELNGQPNTSVLDLTLDGTGTPTGGTGQYNATALPYAQLAASQRTYLANRILNKLCYATGTAHPTAFAGVANYKLNPQFQASMWLAQIATNIVDFVDPDDVLTQLKITVGTDNYFIFGTELPKVVLNEVYAQIDNEATDYNKTVPMPIANDYKYNIFLELLNPTSNTASNISATNGAVLEIKTSAATHSIYELEVVRSYDSMGNSLIANTNLTNPVDYANLKGSLRDNTNTFNNSDILASISNRPPSTTTTSWSSTATASMQKIDPAGSNFSGTTNFKIVGPTTPVFNISPSNSITPDIAIDKLTFDFAKNNKVALKSTPPTDGSDNWAETTVFLRRLADPGLPFQGDISQPQYNPFITVDTLTITSEMVNDGRKRNTDAMTTLVPKPAGTRTSFGRRQPYAGFAANSASTTPWPTLGAYVAQAPSGASDYLHTLGRHNTKATATTGPGTQLSMASETMESPDWLPFFDRKPISPLGLLMVSTYRPHELTQHFLLPRKDPSGSAIIWNSQMHSSAWLDEKTGLQRFLEMVNTQGSYAMNRPNTSNPSRSVDLLPQGGRIPGKVNINTTPIFNNGSIYVSPVLEALYDANTNNQFSATDVAWLIQEIQRMRTLNGTTGNPTAIRPFDGLSRDFSLLQSKVPSPTNPIPPDLYDAWDTILPTGGGGLPPLNFKGNLALDPFSYGINNGAQMPTGSPPRPARDNPKNSTQVHPMVRLESLEKLFNQVTLRSNTFAVWLTVGFFEVDETNLVNPSDLNSPPVLKWEMGRYVLDSAGNPKIDSATNLPILANKETRYKMFALVDRTRLKSFETKLNLDIPLAATGSPLNKVVPDYIDQQITDPRTGKVYNLGTLTANNNTVYLTIDPDTEDEENLVLDGSNQLTFRKPHSKNAKVINRGNPGPWLNYNINDDSEVTFFWTILE